MITLHLSNGIYIENSEEIDIRDMQLIKSELTFNNPEYINKVKRNLWVGKTDKYISLIRNAGKYLLLPIGYLNKLKMILWHYEYKILDVRTVLPEIEYISNIKLREYQVEAVDKLSKSEMGGIIAICGAGKTNIAIEVLARVKQKTLWICHTKELLNQTRERMLNCLNIDKSEIGTIEGGKINIGSKITIALVQTLNKADLNELRDKFGCIILDEAHHLPANTFYNTVTAFKAKHKYYVTATPEREDGLTEVLNRAMGDIVHEINRDDMKNYSIIPKLKLIKTNFTAITVDDDNNEKHFSKLMQELCEDKERNLLIKNAVIEAYNSDRNILLLSDRVTHLEEIKTLLQGSNIDSTILSGTVKKKDRENIIKDVNDRKIKVLLATKLAREGLDITHLDCLILATPKKAKGAVVQEVGRIMRICEGKTSAEVIDFIDDKLGIFKNQYWKRRAAYKDIKII